MNAPHSRRHVVRIRSSMVQEAARSAVALLLSAGTLRRYEGRGPIPGERGITPGGITPRGLALEGVAVSQSPG